MIPRRDPFVEFELLIRSELATSLGQAGKKLRTTLEQLARFDASPDTRDAQRRTTLVQNATDSLHAYLVQKELNGITDNEALKRAYPIPAEIWKRLGYAEDAE